MHLYLLQKSSGIITAAVYSNFFAPKQHALDGGTRSTHDGGTLEGSSLVGGVLDGGVRSALDGGALDVGALDGGTLDGGVRFFGTLGGKLGGGTLTLDCS